MKRNNRVFNQLTLLNSTLTLTVAGGLVAGCVCPTDQPLPAQTACYTEEFQRQTQANGSLDLLFVTDTSGSLEDKKSRIASEIDAFVAELPSSFDYQIAVMPAHGSTSYYSGRLYSYAGNAVVLSSKTMSLSKIQTELRENLVNALSDYYSDGGEEGLYSLYHAMDSSNLQNSRNYGFFRPTAALAVVFISDENDICAIYPAGVTRVPDPTGLEALAFKRDCAGITPQSVLSRVQQMMGGRTLIIDGIVYTNPATVPKGPGIQDEYGYGYMDLIQLAQGTAIDIGLSDYSDGLSQIAKLAVQQMTPTVDFKLSHAPVDPSSISVTLVSSSTTSSGGNCSNQGGDDDRDSKIAYGSVIPNPVPSSSSGQSATFDFDATTNMVQLTGASIDSSAPYADIHYCLVSPSPTPSAKPSPSPSVAPSPSPSVKPSPDVAPSPSPAPTETVTTPSPTPSPVASVTPVPSPSPTETVSPIPSPSPTCTGPFCGGGIIGT